MEHLRYFLFVMQESSLDLSNILLRGKKMGSIKTATKRQLSQLFRSFIQEFSKLWQFIWPLGTLWFLRYSDVTNVHISKCILKTLSSWSFQVFCELSKPKSVINVPGCYYCVSSILFFLNVFSILLFVCDNSDHFLLY